MRSSLAISTSLTYGGNYIGRGAGALPAPLPGQAYVGVDPAHPMDEQNDLGCIGADIGNQLMDHGADDALLQPYLGRGVVQTPGPG